MWKDTTSYSQGQRGKVEPRTWTAEAEGVRITVTNNHLHAPGKWVMHCFSLGMDTVDTKLDARQPAHLAQFAAKNMAVARGKQIITALSKIEAPSS